MCLSFLRLPNPPFHLHFLLPYVSCIFTPSLPPSHLSMLLPCVSFPSPLHSFMASVYSPLYLSSHPLFLPMHMSILYMYFFFNPSPSSSLPSHLSIHLSVSFLSFFFHSFTSVYPLVSLPFSICLQKRSLFK